MLLSQENPHFPPITVAFRSLNLAADAILTRMFQTYNFEQAFSFRIFAGVSDGHGARWMGSLSWHAPYLSQVTPPDDLVRAVRLTHERLMMAPRFFPATRFNR